MTEDLFDTTTSKGRLVFGIFALLAEDERGRIRERTMAGLTSTRARGRKGGCPKVLTKEKIALAFEALQNRNKTVKRIAKGLGVSEATVYRYQRELRDVEKNNYPILHVFWSVFFVATKLTSLDMHASSRLK